MTHAHTVANRPTTVVGLLVLTAATIAGLWAIATTLSAGHIQVATTQHVPWGLWVALYIFFLGLSSGSFLLSTLVYVFGVKRFEPAGPMALLQALVCLVLGGVLIVLDLGHPGRVYLVLTSMNPSSPMAWIGVFYNVYILVILLQLYLVYRPRLIAAIRAGDGPTGLYRLLALGSSTLVSESLARDRKWLRRLGLLGIPVAVIVPCGVGMIFAVAKARPNWFGGLFPILFLISALASGGGLLTLLAATSPRIPADRKRDLVRSLAQLSVAILVFDVLLLLADAVPSLYGAVPHEADGWLMIFFGPFWWMFWFVQIGLGTVLPIVLVAMPATRDRTEWLGLAGGLIVLGMVATRLNIVIPAQIVPSFASLSEAYHHPRFTLGYFPSANEWLVALGVATLGVWMSLALMRFLPGEGAARESAVRGGNLT